MTILPALLLCAFSMLAPVSEADPEPVRISQFSGKEVPRFESLRYDAVHGRSGPSTNHSIIWRYERKGLPMLIIKETDNWRRVRDPSGDEVWIQADKLSSQREVLVTREADLRRKPDTGSQARARLEPGVLGELEGCEKGWCEIKVERTSGWVEAGSLWGVIEETGGL